MKYHRHLMKFLASLLVGFAWITTTHAEFENWTNKDGKTTELDLQKVTPTGGEFKTRAGKTAIIKPTDLSAADAKRLSEWKPVVVNLNTSVFDKALDGNLIVLKGKKFASLKELVKPTKYYLFYYTASWCPPCQAFTPKLVAFYDAKKPGNSEFEVILVTSDSDEDSMQKYAVEKKMGWPQLKLSKVERFKKEFNHPGSGIPNLVLTNPAGEILKASYVDKQYQGPGVVMDYLDTLLKK